MDNIRSEIAIVLFAYNRPEHLKRTLHALKQNTGASDYPLFIQIDGAKDDSQIEAVNEVRQVAEEFEWVGLKSLSCAPINKGLKRSIVEGCNEVFEFHDKIIVLEDDLITSTGFLNFMADSLEFYQNREEVFGISGFAFAVESKLPQTYFLPIASSWGWATWRDKWERISFDSKSLWKDLSQHNRRSEFDFGTYPYTAMLESQVKDHGNSWAILFYTSMFLQKGLFLFPSKSLVHNIGFDETGTNEVTGYKFTNPEVVASIASQKIEVGLNEQVLHKVKDTFRESIGLGRGQRLKRKFVNLFKS